MIAFAIAVIASVIVAFVMLRSRGAGRAALDSFSPPSPESLPGGDPSIDPWPFDQPRNAASITMRQILQGSEPILTVTHDSDDHGWQFIGRTDANFEGGRVVCLEHIVARAPSIFKLADLPPGWQATRPSPKHPWNRSLRPPDEDEEL